MRGKHPVYALLWSFVWGGIHIRVSEQKGSTFVSVDLEFCAAAANLGSASRRRLLACC